jgi:hypothetical protein
LIVTQQYSIKSTPSKAKARVKVKVTPEVEKSKEASKWVFLLIAIFTALF